jgi:hypothetical protein
MPTGQDIQTGKPRLAPLARKPRKAERLLYRLRYRPWFRGKDFTIDWTSEHFASWHRVLSPWRHLPLRIVEIGSWEGRSAVFFLNFFPGATIACIDTFVGNAEEETYRRDFTAVLPQIGQRFDRNLAPFAGRFEKIVSPSVPALERLDAQGRHFDLAYIDGNHRRDEVMADSLGVWRILAPGGVVIWDDYTFGLDLPPEERPQPAVDEFLTQHEGEYRLLARGKQVIIERVR